MSQGIEVSIPALRGAQMPRIKRQQDHGNGREVGPQTGLTALTGRRLSQQAGLEKRLGRFEYRQIVLFEVIDLRLKRGFDLVECFAENLPELHGRRAPHPHPPHPPAELWASKSARV